MGDNDKFIRWQSILREQFSSSTNLILALATGLLAFQSSLLVGDGKLANSAAIVLCIASILSLIASVISGVICSVVRLHDFRATAKIARASIDAQETLELRDRASELGRVTWQLFWTQLALFSIGGVLGIFPVLVEGNNSAGSILGEVTHLNIAYIASIVFQIVGTVMLSAMSFWGLRIEENTTVRGAGKPMTFVSLSKRWLLTGQIGLISLIVGIILSGL